MTYRVSSQRARFAFSSITTQLPAVISLLFIVSIRNAVLKRWRSCPARQPSEFTVIYAASTVAAAISAQDEVRYLILMWTYPFRSSEARDAGPSLKCIPRWLAQSSSRLLNGYCTGHASIWQFWLIRAWLVPLGCWMLWLAELGAMM